MYKVTPAACVLCVCVCAPCTKNLGRCILPTCECVVWVEVWWEGLPGHSLAILCPHVVCPSHLLSLFSPTALFCLWKIRKTMSILLIGPLPCVYVADLPNEKLTTLPVLVWKGEVWGTSVFPFGFTNRLASPWPYIFGQKGINAVCVC